jgi:LemA protein
MEWLIYVLIGIAVLALIFFIWYFTEVNAFNTMLVKIDESESSIDIALTKRYDILTKMVSATKGYMKHEQETLTKVISMRQPAHNAPIAEKEAFANQLSAGLSAINVVAEQYPDLKASANFAKLQDATVEVEENLQAARRVYNSNVSPRKISSKLKQPKDKTLSLISEIDASLSGRNSLVSAFL